MVIFYGQEFLAPGPSYQSRGPTLVGCLFHVFAAALRIWKPFLQPQREDAPWSGDRDPLITAKLLKQSKLHSPKPCKCHSTEECGKKQTNKFLTAQGNVCLCGVGIVTRLQAI